MASKFGSGYFTDWESMEIAIKKGLQQAFERACNRVCEEADDYIRGGIYNNLHMGTYDDFRTFEMGAISYLTPNISGTYCSFSFNDKEIMSLSHDEDEVAHHALSTNGGGYDAESYMWDIINPNHDFFMNDVRDYIQKNWQKIYREECIALGIQLS